MNGLNFFRMPCHIDDDIAELEAEFGVKAFAVIVRLWQKIYSEEGYYCEWSDRSPLLFLAKYFGGNSGLELNLIMNIVERAVRIGIFDRGMYEKHHILTSADIQNSFLFAAKRRTNICLNPDYLLVKVGQNVGNVCKNEKNVRKNEKNVDRNEQRKGKDRIVKDSKDSMSEQKDAPKVPKAELPETTSFCPLPTKNGDDYVPDMGRIEEWKKLCPDVDMAWESKKMKIWLSGKPERKKTMRGMNRFVGSWLARAQDEAIEKKRKAAEGATKKNRFQNFQQREYDDSLERKLLEIV